MEARSPLEICLGVIAECFFLRPEQLPPKVIAAVTDLALQHGQGVQHAADQAAAITLRAPPFEESGRYTLMDDELDEVTRIESIYGRRPRKP